MKIKYIFPAAVLLSIVYCLLFTACCLLPTANSFSQGTWARKTDFGGIARLGAVGFSIGTKGYFGTGYNGYQDFWEWNQSTDTWTQKANFGGGGRSWAAGFSIGDKGYIGTGNGSKTFWEWDQTNNSWTQMADFGGTGRNSAIGFSICTKGYIGMGMYSGTYYKDFWEWNQANNTWTQMADFGGAARWETVGFSIGNKGYIGTGNDGSGTLYNDFWEWDQANNTWTQKADFLGAAREGATGFSIGNYGYIGLGLAHDNPPYYNDFYQYDPSNNVWTLKASFGGAVRGHAAGFSIGCKGYIGLGASGIVSGNWTLLKKDFWEYTPHPDSCSTLKLSVSAQNISCNGQCTGTATVNSLSCTLPYMYAWNTLPVQTTQTATGLCAGGYTVTVTDTSGATATATIIITQPTPLTATVTTANSTCGNNDGTAALAAAGGSPSYTYLWTPSGSTNQSITGLGSGTYTATVTDSNGCALTQTVAIVSSGKDTAVNKPASICSGYTYTLPGGTVVSAAGIYKDTLTAANGCDSIITTDLTVNPQPTATVFSIPALYGQVVTITQGQSATLTATGGGTYAWSPATGLNCTNCTAVTVTPFWGVGGLMYCVTVTDANGCTDDTCITVVVEPIDCSTVGEIYLPTAFSPNGDGENDELKMYYGDMRCIQSFKLIIYDRWGEKIYKTEDSKFYWDGKYKGGTLYTSVLIYYLNVTLRTDEDITKKGNISLIR